MRLESKMSKLAMPFKLHFEVYYYFFVVFFPILKYVVTWSKGTCMVETKWQEEV